MTSKIIIGLALLLLTSCVAVENILGTESRVSHTNVIVDEAKEIRTNVTNTPEEILTLEKKIGQMLMVGFFGTSAKPNSKICQDIRNYNLGGVILFDFNPTNKSKPKNISGKKQLTQLTKALQLCSPDNKLLIAVDQEGGRVQRLKNKYGFYGNFPKASEITVKDENEVRNIYENMGKELRDAGINFNLAPVVDLSINPKNIVINKLGRSFGKDPEEVAKYTTIFMNAMHKNHVLTSLKHFPGHGSSLGDTHKGFVDVTNDWKDIELSPYRILIGKNNIDTIMVAHVFNKTLDDKYPASLSEKTIHGTLRKGLNYKGVVITDDLQMGAIDKKFGLKETLRLAINAGDDILLFGNQLNPRNILPTEKLVNEILELVYENKIGMDKINSAYSRIQKLKDRYFNTKY